jgi:hypothetical protein
MEEGKRSRMTEEYENKINEKEYGKVMEGI